jgi:formylglycine-generating enzyme
VPPRLSLFTLCTLASSASVTGCDGLRPSTFTAGWSDPGPSASSDALPEQELPDGQAAAADPIDEAEDEAPGLAVFDDWRKHVEPSKPCPPEMVLIRDYCIDRWEGSLLEVTANGLRPFPPTHRVEQHRVRAVSRPEVIPQGYITGAEAQRACEMAGKRLCTDAEWFRACEGPKGTIYPYGTVLKKNACNGDRKLHPVVELYGKDSGNDIWMVEPMNNPAINEQPDTVALTGSHTQCVGPWGLFDMVGNLEEWTADPAGSFWGGAYSTSNGIGCQYVTTVHGFGYHDYSTGFRCCSEPNTP